MAWDHWSPHQSSQIDFLRSGQCWFPRSPHLEWGKPREEVSICDVFYSFLLSYRRIFAFFVCEIETRIEIEGVLAVILYVSKPDVILRINGRDFAADLARLGTWLRFDACKGNKSIVDPFWNAHEHVPVFRQSYREAETATRENWRTNAELKKISNVIVRCLTPYEEYKCTSHYVIN